MFCDDIMDKIQKPRGLIRYTIRIPIRKMLNLKLIRALLVIVHSLDDIVFTFVVLLARRSNIETTILRALRAVVSKPDEKPYQ